MTKKKIIAITLSVILIAAAIGVASYFIYQAVQDKKKESSSDVPSIPEVPNPPGSEILPPSPQLPPNLTNSVLKTQNLINNIGPKTGFIGNNYQAILNPDLLKNPKYPININKLTEISGISSAQYKSNPYLYLSRNNISDHSFVGMDINVNNSRSIRIGHWNVLNYNLLSNETYNDLKTWANANAIYSKEAVHTYYLAALISYLNFDLIGLTEINANVPDTNLTNFIDFLNTFNPSSHYVGILSPNLQGLTQTGNGQTEKVAIIYDENDIKINNSKVYDNPLYVLENNKFIPSTSAPVDPIDIKKYYDYVRPPFCVSFNSTKDLNITYSVAYSHNDSPGNSKNELKAKHTQGQKEVFEAEQVSNVLSWLKSNFASNSLPIYMGDTNIKTNNQSYAFSTITNEYEFAFLDNKYYNSSLASLENAINVVNNINSQISTTNNFTNLNWTTIADSLSKFYSNQYDKIIYDKKINVKPYVTNSSLTDSTFINSNINESYKVYLNKVYYSSNNLMLIYKKED